MKTRTTRLIYSASLIGLMAICIVSCKSKKALSSIQQQTGAIEISVPFSSKEFFSNNEFFRGKSSGNSPDLQTAKKIAMQNAKSEMASTIQTTIKKVTDQYTNQRQTGDVQEFSNKFEELAREVTNQQLLDVRTIGEKMFKEANNSFTYWVAIEANKETVLNGIEKNISSNKKLEQDYDKKKFEEIFNQEMEKLSKERGF